MYVSLLVGGDREGEEEGRPELTCSLHQRPKGHGPYLIASGLGGVGAYVHTGRNVA